MQSIPESRTLDKLGSPLLLRTCGEPVELLHEGCVYFDDCATVFLRSISCSGQVTIPPHDNAWPYSQLWRNFLICCAELVVK